MVLNSGQFILDTTYFEQFESKDELTMIAIDDIRCFWTLEFIEIQNDLYLDRISVVYFQENSKQKAISKNLYRKHTNPLFIYDAMVNA